MVANRIRVDAHTRLSACLAGDDPVETLYLACNEVVFRGDPRFARPERLASAARHLYLAGTFRGEVFNGGVSQFFSNSSGDFVPETLDALRAIGAEGCVRLLQDALIAFDHVLPPRDRGARCDVLFAFEEREPDALGALDEALWEEALPDLEELAQAFATAHADDSILERG